MDYEHNRMQLPAGSFVWFYRIGFCTLFLEYDSQGKVVFAKREYERQREDDADRFAALAQHIAQKNTAFFNKMCENIVAELRSPLPPLEVEP